MDRHGKPSRLTYILPAKRQWIEERKLKRRERPIYLNPINEEILAEVKQQEAAKPNDEQAIDDSNIMEDPAEAEVIIPGTSELNINEINHDLLSTIQGI